MRQRGTAPGSSQAEAVAQRERRLAERFLEDEALRRGLDDATWQPIQDWLLLAVGRLAATTRGLDESAAQTLLDRGQQDLRRLTLTLAAAVERSTSPAQRSQLIRELAADARPSFVDPAAAARLAERLAAADRHLAARPADPATAARLLVAALGEGSPVVENQGDRT